MVDAHLVLAWLHPLALAIGLGGVWARARALRDAFRKPDDSRALRRALVGEGWWCLAALLWIVTGVWLLVSGSATGPTRYLANEAFQIKVALFVAIIALEIWPTMTMIRWRFARAEPNAHDAGRIEAISYVQCTLVVAIVLAAVSMPRSDAASAGATHAASAPRPVEVIASGEVTPPSPPSPSGVETVTNADLALLMHEIRMPLEGIDPDSLQSSFDAPRAAGTRTHHALDIMAPRLTPIFSATKGRVLKLFTSIAGGLMVYAADSSERFILLYAHLDHYAPDLRDSARLSRGQLIGFVGSTGNASANAPHLHFGILRSADVRHWSKGTPIDPLPVLQASARASGSLAIGSTRAASRR